MKVEDMVIREMKCLWKTGLNSNEAVQFEKKKVYHSFNACMFCRGYKKSCPNYVRRVVNYIQ